MQTLESFFQALTGGQVASFWLASYYAFLVFLLGLLSLALLSRRLVPFLLALAQEDAKSARARKIRLAWAFAVFLAPVYVFCRVEGAVAGVAYKLAASVFFFALAFVAAEIAIVLFFHVLFRRLLSIHVSAIFKDLFRVIVYLFAVVSIVRNVFGIEDLGTLVAVSSAASIIVGLALQDSLGSIFSGLFLQVDSPISLGDWVEIDGLEGRVIEVTWFSTRMVTRENQMVAVPNRRVAQAVIKNYNRPTLPMMVRKRLGVSYGCAPHQVKDVLNSHMRQVDGVLADPPPSVFLVDYAESSINYELRFWVSDIARVTAITDAVMTGIWYHLRRAEMEIPFPIRTVYLKRDAAPAVHNHKIVAVLVKVDFLAPVEPTELEVLAAQLRHVLYARQETVFRQGDPGETFFIIWSGSVSIRVKKEKEGEEVTLARLSRGDYFGEMSLLTGEPRRATVVAEEDTDLLCLDRSSFGMLLARNPGITERMSHILAHRLAATQSRLEEHEKDTMIRRRSASSAEDSMYGKILSGIRHVFGV